MTGAAHKDLGLSAAEGGCACGHDAEASTTPLEADRGGVIADFYVAGMTCSHCVNSVTEEVSSMPSVTGVAVDLNPGSLSRVTVSSTAPLDEADVRNAVESAGYALAPAP